MRRVPLSIVMLLACPLIAFAQDASAQEVSADPARVLARLMTFDRNQDGRLVESELPERMRSVLSRDINHDRGFSEHTAQAIDQEVKKILSNALDKVKSLLETNRDKLETMAKALTEKEILNGDEVNALLGLPASS